MPHTLEFSFRASVRIIIPWRRSFSFRAVSSATRSLHFPPWNKLFRTRRTSNSSLAISVLAFGRWESQSSTPFRRTCLLGGLLRYALTASASALLLWVLIVPPAHSRTSSNPASLDQNHRSHSWPLSGKIRLVIWRRRIPVRDHDQFGCSEGSS